MSARRRSTESSSSKLLSASKEKSLSAVTLTKKTNSLVSDVEELKSNLKELQVQGREAVQQDQTLQELVAKVERLQNAFDSLSDVVIEEIDGIQKTMQDQDRRSQSRLAAIEDSVAKLQEQVSRVDGKGRQLQNSVDRRFENAQDNFSKFALSQYEAQSELLSLKNSTEQILSREREAARSLQSLQSSHDQVFEWVQTLRRECSRFQTELFAFKEETGGTCLAVASDVQSIAKECSNARTAVSQSHSQLQGKIEALREAMDRQAKLDRNQLGQRLDVLRENLATYELRSKEAFTTLLKNHSRIRVALDEGMGICSNELRALAHECKASQSDQQSRLDALAEQLARTSLEWIKKHEDLESALRAL